MYGSDAGQPVPSLYTKGLSPLCDNLHLYILTNFQDVSVVSVSLIHIYEPFFSLNFKHPDDNVVVTHIRT